MIARICAWIAPIGALLVSDCLAPEKGDVTIVIDRDGGYSFTYRGGVAYLLGLAAKASGKPIKSKDIQSINDALAGLKKDPQFASVTPAGFSRVTVSYKTMRHAGQSFAFIGDAKMISVTADPRSGTLHVSSAKITAREAAKLRQIGYNPEINVMVTSALPVAAQNGTIRQAMLIGCDSYHWKIDYNQRAPIDMVVRLPR